MYNNIPGSSVVPDALLVPHRVLDRVLDPSFLKSVKYLAYLVRPHWARAVGKRGRGRWKCHDFGERLLWYQDKRSDNCKYDIIMIICVYQED